MSTHRARIRPGLQGHGQHSTLGINFERIKGWYPVTEDQSAYLAKQPAYEGQPHGERLFDTGTLEWAVDIDRVERRNGRGGATARNPTDPKTGQVPLEEREVAPAELLQRLADAENRAASLEAKDRDRDKLMAAVAAKLGIDIAGLFDGSGTKAAPEGEKPDAEAAPAKPLRPGAAARPKPTTAPATEVAHEGEKPASNG